MIEEKWHYERTFFNPGVKLRDLDGQPVDPRLQHVRPLGQVSRLARELAEHVLRMLGQRRQLSANNNKYCENFIVRPIPSSWQKGAVNDDDCENFMINQM